MFPLDDERYWMYLGMYLLMAKGNYMDNPMLNLFGPRFDFGGHGHSNGYCKDDEKDWA